MMPRFERWLRRYGAVVAGVLSPLVIWLAWGQVDPIAVIHDEASYVLQAEIFATGRWTVPSPPAPEFFEQPHVQVVPAVASKYPPGHALLLSLGALVGFTALVPLLLTGATAALLFALVTRVSSPWAALLAWPTWLFAPMVLRFQPSYMSEITTTLLVLSAWWALLSWRETRKRGWLLTLALCVGWGAITRPLTMLAFAVPIGIVVIADASRERRWRDLGMALGVGVAVLSVLPLWSARTTGSWRETPIEKYRLDYLPFDKMGFTADATPPRRRESMSRVLDETYQVFFDMHKKQTLAALPVTAAQRMMALARDFFWNARSALVVLAVAGLFFVPSHTRFAAVSALLLFVAYLPYAHWEGWTLYYLEAAPVAAALAGIGGWGLVRRLGDNRANGAALALAGLVVLVGFSGTAEARRQRLGSRLFILDRQIRALLPRLPSPGILFVRYSPRIMPNPPLVLNSANLDREPMWVVHDLGPRNDELRRLAPDRATHSLDIDRLVRGRR